MQDMFQSLEKLKATLLSLSAGTRRLSEREKAERAVAALQQSYEQCLKQAKEKQNQMESLMSHWQKYVLLSLLESNVFISQIIL